MGGVCMCMGKFANKRKASGCFFQGKETKTITNNIIFPIKTGRHVNDASHIGGVPIQRRRIFAPPSPLGCPDAKAPTRLSGDSSMWKVLIQGHPSLEQRSPGSGKSPVKYSSALVPRHPAKGKSPVEDWTPSYHDTPHRCTPTHKGFHEGARANDGRALAFATAAEDCLFFRRVCRGWAGSKHHKEGLGLDQCRSKIKRHTKNGILSCTQKNRMPPEHCLCEPM